MFKVQCGMLKNPHTIRKSVGREVPSVVAVLCAVSSGWGGKILGILAYYTPYSKMATNKLFFCLHVN